MPTIDATVGGANSNSYETQAEADQYFDNRLPLTPPWQTTGDTPKQAMIMATKNLDAYGSGVVIMVPQQGSTPAYKKIGRKWTGSPASATQKLAWPRIGMFDRNGNAIPSDVIPQDLKDAESEFAGQLLKTDRTLDNDVIVQGVTSVSAGSVSVSFKEQIFAQVVPDAVVNLLVPGWLTDETIEYVTQANFDVVSPASEPWPVGGRL